MIDFLCFEDHVSNMDWLEREMVMGEQLERGTDEQRKKGEANEKRGTKKGRRTKKKRKGMESASGEGKKVRKKKRETSRG